MIDAFYAGYDTINPGRLRLSVQARSRSAPAAALFRDSDASGWQTNPRIATCSGKAYIEENGKLVNERHGDETSLGMTKFYRVSCFKAIGGFVREVMWDGIDCHRCRMNGWIACSWDEPELRFVHLRPMGPASRASTPAACATAMASTSWARVFCSCSRARSTALNEKPYVVGQPGHALGLAEERLQASRATAMPEFPHVSAPLPVAGAAGRQAQGGRGVEPAMSTMPPDFNRNVHCVLGLPFDTVTEAEAAGIVGRAARERTRCFFSTPNLNFVAGCLGDEVFRSSVLQSDLSLADGVADHRGGQSAGCSAARTGGWFWPFRTAVRIDAIASVGLLVWRARWLRASGLPAAQRYRSGCQMRRLRLPWLWVCGTNERPRAVAAVERFWG